MHVVDEVSVHGAGSLDEVPLVAGEAMGLGAVVAELRLLRGRGELTPKGAIRTDFLDVAASVVLIVPCRPLQWTALTARGNLAALRVAQSMAGMRLA